MFASTRHLLSTRKRGFYSPLNSVSGLPSWMGVGRGAGSWSRQIAPAVSGTTFLELGNAQNTPRWDYDPTSGLLMLLIEPTRTNKGHLTQFGDAGPNEGVPDGWAVAAGVGDTDFDCQDTDAPHGGASFRLLDTAVANRGVYVGSGVVANGVTYAATLWTKRTAGAATTLRSFVDPAVAFFADHVVGAGPYDWKKSPEVFGTIAGAGGATTIYMCASVDPEGIVTIDCVQVEAGDCASSYIPTPAAADVTRAAELCTIDPAVVGRLSGRVGLLWRPDYPSTAALTVSPVMFAWAAGYEVIYDPADDKVKVVVAGVNRAQSAALAFARQSLHTVDVTYGAAGQQLTVDGVTTNNATAWGDPGALAPYLGSRAASVNCRPAAYAGIVLVGG